MNNKFRIIFILSTMFSLIFILSTCKKELSEIPSNYSIADAIEDGCVVFEGLSLKSGSDLWKDFYEKSLNGDNTTIRLVKSSKTEVITWIKDIDFTAGSYTLMIEDEDAIQYNYLNYYIIDIDDNPNYSKVEYYILVDEQDVTFAELEYALISSYSETHIRQNRIYVNFIK